MLADGERGALIGPRGELAWMCGPRSALRPRAVLAGRPAGQSQPWQAAAGQVVGCRAQAAAAASN